ncbi:MAG: MarC family protein [Burkholderiales bacterium]
MTSEDIGLIKGVLLVVGALFPIVNPIGHAPIFLTLTADQDDATRKVLARKVAINGFILLLAAMFVGEYVLDFFGVSIPVAQVAGGLVVASLGWKLLAASDAEPAAPPPVRPATTGIAARAFYPLTLPLTVGPGAISVAITIGANFPSTVQPFIADAISSAIGALLVCLSTWLCFRHAQRLMTMLGTGGTAVVMRLMAFILLCIGVQIVWNGADALFGFSRMR